jgi:DegV family protein with EDD domain
MLDRFERFSFAISEISRCWRKLATEELAKYDLKSSHVTYLTTMYQYPDGITVPKLCEVSGKDKSDASRMIAILEEKGLAQKKVVDGSLYRGLWVLTEQGKNAAEELSEKYPDRRIMAVDSLCASLGQGLLVKLAVDKKNEGASIEELAAYLESEKWHLAHWFTVEDLFFLHRGGRVSKATAILGTALQFKPIMHVDDEGHLVKNVKPDKVRGRNASITELFNQMKRTAINPEKQTVYISHGDCYEDAKKLADMITAEWGITDILISEVGPVIGAHSGPGTLALFFLGSER